MGTRSRKEARAAFAPKRLQRLLSLRAKKAPAWIIKSEQVALVLNRRGLKFYPVGAKMSAAQAALYSRHVLPLMEETAK